MITSTLNPERRFPFFSVTDSARKKEGSQVTVARIQQRRAIALHLLSPDPRFLLQNAKMYRTVPRMAGYVNLYPCACFAATCPRWGWAVGISLRSP